MELESAPQALIHLPVKFVTKVPDFGRSSVMRSIKNRKGVPLKRPGALNSPGRRLILMATLVGLLAPGAIADESKIDKKLAK